MSITISNGQMALMNHLMNVLMGIPPPITMIQLMKVLMRIPPPITMIQLMKVLMRIPPSMMMTMNIYRYNLIYDTLCQTYCAIIFLFISGQYGQVLWQTPGEAVPVIYNLLVGIYIHTQGLVTCHN